MKPTQEELRDTVRRMETTLKQSQRSEVEVLLSHYRQLGGRFQTDLDNERDIELAKASVLMLIQAVAHSA